MDGAGADLARRGGFHRHRRRLLVLRSDTARIRPHPESGGSRADARNAAETHVAHAAAADPAARSGSRSGARRPLPPRARAGEGRHGPRARGARRKAGPPRGGEGGDRSARSRPGAALRAGSADRWRPRAPQRAGGLRSGRAGRSAVPGHRAAGRAHLADRDRWSPAPSFPGAGGRAPTRPWPRRGARARHRAPRPQAGESLPH